MDCKLDGFITYNDIIFEHYRDTGKREREIKRESENVKWGF